MKKVLFFFVLLVAANGLVIAQDATLTKEQLFALFNQAGQAEKEGRDQDAINNYLTIVKHAPQIPETYYRLGNLLGKKEDRTSIEMAITYYTNYLTLLPNADNADEVREEILRLQRKLRGLPATATAQVKPGDKSPADTTVKKLTASDYMRIGNNYFDKKQYKPAIENFEKAKDLNETDEQYYYLCLSYVGLKDKDNAELALKNYERLSPDGAFKKELKQAIKKMNEEQYDRVSGLDLMKFYLGINYRYSLNMGIKYEGTSYKSNPLQGGSIQFISGSERQLKFGVDLAYNWIKISKSMDSTGIFTYPWGDQRDNIMNVDLRFKGIFVPEKPLFSLGEKNVARFIGSFGAGLGYLTTTGNPWFFYPDQGEEPDPTSKVLSGFLNYLSYEATVGILFSQRSTLRGLKIELVGAGYWQFDTEYRFQPYAALQVGWVFGFSRH